MELKISLINLLKMNNAKEFKYQLKLLNFQKTLQS